MTNGKFSTEEVAAAIELVTARQNSYAPNAVEIDFDNCRTELYQSHESSAVERWELGQEVWNDWATKLLRQKAELISARKWTPEIAKDWEDKATVRIYHQNFTNTADFEGFIFPGHTRFNKRHFEMAQFTGARFFGNISFSECTFDSADFDNAEFLSDIDFRDSHFSISASFNHIKCQKGIDFSGVKFSGITQFKQAEFSHHTSFRNVSFSQTATFAGAKFGGQVSFRGVRAKRSLALEGTIFASPPNFSGAQFQEHLDLDSVKISPPPFWPKKAKLNSREGETGWATNNDVSAWRKLKSLAIAAHDHESELNFFSNEVKARRWKHDKWYSAQFWFGIFYEIFSDFGRSYFRPFAGWAFFVGIFWLVYLSTSVQAGCKESLLSSFYLSLKNSLLVIGWERSYKVSQVYSCLYGAPEISTWLAIAGMFHTLLSAIFVFLFLLAIRNHFRIN